MGGGALAPAYDFSPTPADVRPRVLTTNIDLDEGACDLALVESVAELFGLGPKPAREIIAQVGQATRVWRGVAAEIGERPAEVRRMQSAFEHADLERALAL